MPARVKKKTTMLILKWFFSFTAFLKPKGKETRKENATKQIRETKWFTLFITRWKKDESVNPNWKIISRNAVLRDSTLISVGCPSWFQMEGHRRIPTYKSNDQKQNVRTRSTFRWHLVNVVTVCLRNALCYVTQTVFSCLPTIEWLRRGGRKKKKGKKEKRRSELRELKLDPVRRGTDEKGVAKWFYMSQRFAPPETHAGIWSLTAASRLLNLSQTFNSQKGPRFGFQLWLYACGGGGGWLDVLPANNTPPILAYPRPLFI